MSIVWSKTRGYQPGAPLYARKRLQFSGRVVEHGDLIPPEYISSPHQHLTLWRARHAGHEPRVFVKHPTMPSSLVELEAREAAALEELTSPAPTASPAATVQPDIVIQPEPTVIVEPMLVEDPPSDRPEPFTETIHDSEPELPPLPPPPPLPPLTPSRRRDRK